MRYAWGRLIADTLIAAILLRADERRRRASRGRATFRSEGDPDDSTLAGRPLRRAPSAARPIFSLAVIATLALTIGATTAVFTVVNAVLLRALPYRDPSRWCCCSRPSRRCRSGFRRPIIWRSRRAPASSNHRGIRNREYELSGVEPPERVTVTRASATLFETLGVRPALGRPFTREDDEAGRLVAVLSDALWERTFARDPAAIGRPILLDRQPFTIVGVMPRGFTFPQRGPIINNVPADVYVPIGFTASERRAFGSMHNNSVIARLKAGVTPAQADADTRALVRSNAREMYPATLSGLAEVLGGARPLTDEVSGRSRTLLWVAFAAVGSSS